MVNRNHPNSVIVGWSGRVQITCSRIWRLLGPWTWRLWSCSVELRTHTCSPRRWACSRSQTPLYPSCPPIQRKFSRPSRNTVPSSIMPPVWWHMAV